MMKGILKKALGVVAAAALAVTGMAALTGTANAAVQTACGEDNAACSVTLTGGENRFTGHSYMYVKLADYDVYGDTTNGQTMTLVTEADIAEQVADAVHAATGQTVPSGADPLAWAVQEGLLDVSTASPWQGTTGATRKLADTLRDDDDVQKASVNTNMIDATDKDQRTITFTEPGLYLILDQTANATSSKALPMIVGTPLTLTVPDEEEGTMVQQEISSGTVEVKNQTPTITKDIEDNDHSAQTGDDVTYTLTTHVPNYVGYKVNGYTFKIGDKFEDDAPLKYVPDTLNVTIQPTGVETATTLKMNEDYTVTGFDENSKTFTIDLSSYIQKHAFTGTAGANDVFTDVSLVNAAVTVTYDAKVTGQIKQDGALNTPGIEYSNDPTSTNKGEVPGPGQKVFNFKYTVKKIDRQTGELLNGATFAIYRGDSDSGTPYQTLTTGENGQADGQVTFTGLDAGTYTIKETGVPTGYINSNVSFQVTITPMYDGANETMTVTGVTYTVTGVELGQPDAGLVEDATEDDGVAGGTVVVQNAKSIFQLPATGAAGITLFAVLGLLIAGVGVMVYMKSRSVRNAMRA